MHRRTLLKAGLLAALGGAAPLAAAPGMGVAARSFCRAPRSRRAIVRNHPADLVYQGTHILTFGALQDIAEHYRGPDGGRLLVSGGGCDDGITTVRQGTADLGGMCCPIPGSRAEGLPWRQVAWDIKVAVTHPTTPLESLPGDTLTPLARGEIRSWRELGGEDRPIALVVRRHCPDYFEPVRQLLLDGKPEWSARSLWVETDQQLIDTAARFPGAIGFVSRVFATPLIAQGRLKALAIDGTAPDREAVETGLYKLKGPLNMVYREWDEARMAPFFDFLKGREGSAILGHNLVPT